MSALHAKNDTTNFFGYKLRESTENNKALLFLSGKETIQTLNGPLKPLRCCLRSDKLVNSLLGEVSHDEAKMRERRENQCLKFHFLHRR